MFTPYMKNLRVRLQERRDAVLRADYNYLESHLKTFLSFISSKPPLIAITEKLKKELSAQEKNEIMKLLDDPHGEQIELSSDENKRAAHLLQMAFFLTDEKYLGSADQKLSTLFGYEYIQDSCNHYTEHLFNPLYYYYDEKLDDSDVLLYLFFKYKRLCEWFKRGKLYKAVEENPGKRESLLDSNLREFLFKEGVDFPFSKPETPKGKADVVINIEERPLPIEIKLFDDQSYKKDYLRKGFTQALHYANDYNQSIGYLIVFNLSNKLLQFGNNSTENYFPYIEIQNKAIFIIPIDLHPILVSASQDKNLEIVNIDEKDLIPLESEVM